MNINKAIQILEQQKAKLNNQNAFDGTWKIQTSTYLNLFFGNNSSEMKYFKSFSFINTVAYINDTRYNPEVDINKNKGIMLNFIDNCIDTINQKGLYVHPKVNFLNSLSETALWTLIPLVGVGLLSIGLFFGNMYADNKNIELRQENKLIKDSLIILKISTLSNKIPDSCGDKIMNKTIQNKSKIKHK